MIRSILLPRLADILSAAIFGRAPDRAIIDGLHALAQRQAEEIRATRDLLGPEGRGLPLEVGVANVLGALAEVRVIAQEQTERAWVALRERDRAEALCGQRAVERDDAQREIARLTPCAGTTAGAATCRCGCEPCNARGDHCGGGWCVPDGVAKPAPVACCYCGKPVGSSSYYCTDPANRLCAACYADDGVTPNMVMFRVANRGRATAADRAKGAP